MEVLAISENRTERQRTSKRELLVKHIVKRIIVCIVRRNTFFTDNYYGTEANIQVLHLWKQISRIWKHPAPLKPNGRCCDECNLLVIRERIRLATKQK